jgi:hypothetical protein
MKCYLPVLPNAFALNSELIEMLTKKEAIEKVRASLGEGMDVMLDTIIEKEYGWVIFPQTKEFIQTSDPNLMAIGSGGILIEKKTGKAYEFGSAYSTDQNLLIYELGYFRYKNWDIEISRVINMSETIGYLSKLDIRYVVPEEAQGTVWNIPKKYTDGQLKDKLKSLPAKLNLGNVYFRWEQLESLKKQNAFEYRLSENKGYENDI